ncbi:unnamed protein product [Meganyctiphanes norvegica]|uniref:Maturase K n=1 Tax=Meganyctiphanes norvegica TaxID=48144 RepID=A0AAV2RB01_MEGNR
MYNVLASSVFLKKIEIRLSSLFSPAIKELSILYILILSPTGNHYWIYHIFLSSFICKPKDRILHVSNLFNVFVDNFDKIPSFLIATNIDRGLTMELGDVA